MNFSAVLHSRFLLLLILGVFIQGCGGNDTDIPPVGGPPIIGQEPVSQQVPLGSSAHFSVISSGNQLQYTWFQNGSPIQGATSRTYDTPPVDISNNGDTYAVLVSNTDGKALSATATISVGARAPKAGDLRFQNVDADYTLSGYVGELSTFLQADSQSAYSTAFGTPIQIGNGSCPVAPGGTCSWSYTLYAPQVDSAEITTSYVSDSSANLANQLAQFADTNSVVNSIDLESRDGVYASSALTPPASSAMFSATQVLLPLPNLALEAQERGTIGQVITAITPDQGQLLVLEYGWQGDTSDTYDTSVIQCSYSQLFASASQLAANGYILTAAGNDGGGGLILVGSKVSGDSMPRELLTAQVGDGVNTANNLATMAQGGYAIVAYVFDEDSQTNFWVGER